MTRNGSLLFKRHSSLFHNLILAEDLSGCGGGHLTLPKENFSLDRRRSIFRQHPIPRSGSLPHKPGVSYAGIEIQNDVPTPEGLMLTGS